jgi:cytidylate kinase
MVLTSHKIVITIDGPAGSGKSTVGKILAEKLNLEHLSSGKLYRTIAYLKERFGLEEAIKLLDKIEIKNGEIFFEAENIDDKISSEEIGKIASDISKIRSVRDKVNEIQKKLAKESKKGIVVDGRDEGTQVFPEAPVKIFLTASPEERAKRKFEDLKKKGKIKGTKLELENLIEEIRKRDEQDKTREISPLEVPDDAFYIDSTSKSIDEVIELIMNFIKTQKPEIWHFLNEDLK